MTAQALLITAGGRRIALGLEHVQEILDRAPVTTLPQLPEWIVGVADIRGVAVPVVDAGALDGAKVCRDRRSLVLAMAGCRPVALLIDEVEGIVDVSEEIAALTLDLRRVFEGIN